MMDQFIRAQAPGRPAESATYAGAADQAWRELPHGIYGATNAAGEDLRLEVTPRSSSVGPWPAGVDPREYRGHDVDTVAERDGWRSPEWEKYVNQRLAREDGSEPITIYTKDDCQACRATMRSLDKLGIDYDPINIADLPTAVLDEMRDQGLAQAPVVDTGTDAWSGFRPDRIRGLGAPERE